MSGARESLEQRIEALAPGLDIYRTHGGERQPVVIQLHGCGGKKQLQGEWAPTACAAGWAAVVVDSYRHRRISTGEAYLSVCTGMRLWGRERAGDLFAAMEWVRRQPWADASRMVAAGWSHGGWTVLDAMAIQPGADAEAATGLAGLPAEPLAGLRGAFLVYPYCGLGSLARRRGLRVDVAPLAIVGGADVIVGSRSLERTLREMKTAGRPMQVEWFEAATHAFDEPASRDLRTRYDPSLTSRARGMLGEYLGKIAAAG
jgi:dienelactone hydrolase